ncbi:MAG TPA: Hsp20 family protein [Ktedonobacterales bacterium]|nr:Hsp20 family protein [Ktedonobacterales bacterium]
MAMQRWDPFDDMLSLRDAMDRLLQDSFVRPAGSLFTAGRGSVPLDLSENEKNYIISATMPGVKPDDVQINVQGNTLTIRGESRSEENQERRNFIMRERRAVSFHRSVTLPGPVNTEQAEARYENGVLTLTLPKAEAARQKQIKVRSTQGELAGAGQSQATDQGTASATMPTGQQTSGSIPMPPASHVSGDAESDVVGQASEQSFPASDSPSYGSR